MTLGSIAVAIALLAVSLAPSTLAHPDDPTHCERYPDDPKCHQEGPKKLICEWHINGAPASGVTFNAKPGPQLATLDCPHHIVVEWTCGVKGVDEGTGVDSPLLDPRCDHLGTHDSAISDRPCATTSAWTVNIPNVRTYSMFLQAWTFKDEDCDGKPDDWNTSGADGGCLYDNWYTPKRDREWMPYKPAPDGRIDKCDMQIYEHQWRQFN